MITAKVKSNNLVPHGGMFRVVDPFTNIECKGTTFDMLFSNVVRQRRANGAPLGLAFEDEVASWICRDYPLECNFVDPDAPVNRKLHLDDVVRGTEVLLRIVKDWARYLMGLADHPLVEQDEANRRAAICSKCPFNVSFVKPCSGMCPELAAVVNLIRGGRTTPYDGTLQSCSICGCSNVAQVWPRRDLLQHGITEQQQKHFNLIPNCWKAQPI
jgi:hypothetical protein